MPPQLTTMQIRWNDIRARLSGAVELMELLADNFQTPFLAPIANTGRALVTAAETVKRNKDQCAQLMVQICGLLHAIVSVHVKSEMHPDLPPNTLNDLSRFTETLHKFKTYVEAQQETSTIRSFFRQGEMSVLLKDCQTGVQKALEVFKVEDLHLFNDSVKMYKYAEKTHQEILQLIESFSDGSISDKAASITGFSTKLHNSSTSLSLLPSEPKIFHGRGSALSDILRLFEREAPRIVILGPGGMGKTTLARAALHHPEISNRYRQQRFFVACDSASTKLELVALIGAHLELKPGQDLTRPIIQYFENNESCLLILDNLESLWEPLENRREIGDFLSLLSGIQNLALIITMRGVERPAKVQWTRPFLAPLKPLEQDPARHTFIDVAGDGYDTKEIDKILLLTDNLPLAIDLMAHLVDTEGCTNVLARWENEKTAVISEGYDKRSNLDLSISLSLSSPRITAEPQSLALLSLLSVLPDGISDTDLLQSSIPIADILGCKTTLLASSLAYKDDRACLKTLVLIREYMQKWYPPLAIHVQPLLKHFGKLLKLHNAVSGMPSGIRVGARIGSNFMNIQNLLATGLHQTNGGLVATIYSACYLERFSLRTDLGHIRVLDDISKLLPQSSDPNLKIFFFETLLDTLNYDTTTHRSQQDPELFIGKIRECLPDVTNHDLKCNCLITLATHYMDHKNDVTTATDLLEAAIAFATENGCTTAQIRALTGLGRAKLRRGQYAAGQRHAFEAGRIARVSGYLLQEAKAIRIEALCWRFFGQYQRALFLCRRTRDLLQQCGLAGEHMESRVITMQAEIHRLKSEYIDAKNIHKELLKRSSAGNDLDAHAMDLLNMAQIDVELGTPTDEVHKNIVMARSFFETIKWREGMVMCDLTQADLALREGDLATPGSLLQKFISVYWKLNPQVVSYCLEHLGNSQRWNVTVWEPSWTTLYLVHSLKQRETLDIYKALQFIGDIFLAEGGTDTALSLFNLALEGFTKMDVHKNRAECMLRLGDISRSRDNSLKAIQLWNTARGLFARSSQAKQILDVEQRITSINHKQILEHEESITILSQMHAPSGGLNLNRLRTEGQPRDTEELHVSVPA